MDMLKAKEVCELLIRENGRCDNNININSDHCRNCPGSYVNHKSSDCCTVNGWKGKEYGNGEEDEDQTVRSAKNWLWENGFVKPNSIQFTQEQISLILKFVEESMDQHLELYKSEHDSVMKSLTEKLTKEENQNEDKK